MTDILLMDIYQKFTKAIEAASNIIISTHTFPDADGIGSQISLGMALQKIGKKVICVNDEPLLERYHYLDPKRIVLGLEEFKKMSFPKTDLVIVVDTNKVDRTGSNFANFAKNLNCPILYIDHHPCEKSIREGHCIDTTAAATGQLVGNLIRHIKVPFDKDIALPLYTAILIDTSSFRYPTVTADTHRMIADLMDAGVDAPMAYNGIYGTKKDFNLHLLGKVLSSTHTAMDGQIAWISLQKSDLKNYKTDIEDTHAYINHLLVLENIKVACMFRADGDIIKLSLRSTGEYDVGHIAVHLGGGGHSHSAATIIQYQGRTFEQAVQETINEIEKVIKEKIPSFN